MTCFKCARHFRCRSVLTQEILCFVVKMYHRYMNYGSAYDRLEGWNFLPLLSSFRLEAKQKGGWSLRKILEPSMYCINYPPRILSARSPTGIGKLRKPQVCRSLRNGCMNGATFLHYCYEINTFNFKYIYIPYTYIKYKKEFYCQRSWRNGLSML